MCIPLIFAFHACFFAPAFADTGQMRADSVSVRDSVALGVMQPAGDSAAADEPAPPGLPRFSDHGLPDSPLDFRRSAHLLHSPSAATRGTGSGVIQPTVQFVNNSALPHSFNDGALWAGRGNNYRIVAGFQLDFGRVRAVIAPELVVSQNSYYSPRDSVNFWAPEIPADRSIYSLPWYVIGPFSADYPIRFGNDPVRQLFPGQSSILATVGALEAGFSTENHWWGPGVHNALVLSNNAPGFPHFILRSVRPLGTRAGTVEFRWLTGGLTESRFFDADSTNDVRSFSAFAAALRPGRWPDLTLGFTRGVMGTATGWGQVYTRWFDAFRHVPPDQRALSDSALTPGGYEQLTSLFLHWHAPAAGASAWVEWGRAEMPRSFRDLLVAPNHTQAYTIGLAWTRPGFTGTDAWRVRAENTSVESSATFRERPHPVWYTSRRVIQGWTNRGQSLGAAVGPGSSGQQVELDYLRPNWTFGTYAGRHRYNEDVRSIYGWPVWQAWCTHDINLFWGARASTDSPLGWVAVDLTFGNRIQPWFQVTSGCPRGDTMLDVRNNTIAITIAPFARRIATYNRRR